MSEQGCRIGKAVVRLDEKRIKNILLEPMCYLYTPPLKKTFGPDFFKSQYDYEATCPACNKPFWSHRKDMVIGREYLEKLSRIWIKAFDLQSPACAIKNYSNE